MSLSLRLEMFVKDMLLDDLEHPNLIISDSFRFEQVGGLFLGNRCTPHPKRISSIDTYIIGFGRVTNPGYKNVTMEEFIGVLGQTLLTDPYVIDPVSRDYFVHFLLPKYGAK